MRRIIILFILFSGCTYSQPLDTTKISNINFSDDLTLEEFRVKLEEYANNSPYPNIDN
tara:strand:+ start:768 stop:941 length:174 start_codon:yes stop_codon:yes gene_type:complete